MVNKIISNLFFYSKNNIELCNVQLKNYTNIYINNCKNKKVKNERN